MAEGRLGLKDIKALQPGSIVWDSSVKGFGARRQKGKAIAYILVYRTSEGRLRWYTIGRHGSPWTPDTARARAQQILGSVVQGGDPAATKRTARNASTVAELCDFYLEDAQSGRLLTRRKVAKKASTLATDKGRIERHIKPLLGPRKLTAVTRKDVEDFLHAVAEGETAKVERSGRRRGLSIVKGGKGTASRTVGLLSGIFTYAVQQGLRVDNPVRGVMRFADGKRARRLSDQEYEALGRALRLSEDESEWPAAVAVARFLAVTGWRSGEALSLRWSDLDLPRRTAHLPDTKTGASLRPLSRAACAVLESMPKGDGLIFPATKGTGVMTGFPKLWARIAGRAKLPKDITPHVLRHSFTSLASDLGYSELTISALVGHKGHSITSRYVHSADAVLLAAADAIAGKTQELMGEPAPKGVVVPIRKV